MVDNNCTNTTNITTSVEEYLNSLQYETNITLIPSVVCLCLFSVTGIIGNSLVLFVYSQKFRLNTTRILLMTIACFDLVANVGAIPGEMYTMFQYWNFNSPYLCKAKAFINVFATVGGAVTLLAVAVVRYRKVCKPFGWQVTKRHTKAIIGLMALVAFAFTIPYVVLYGRSSKPTECYKIMGHECYTDDKYKGTIWPLVNNGLFVLTYLFSVVALIVLYSLIGSKAKKHFRLHGVQEKQHINLYGRMSMPTKTSIGKDFSDFKDEASNTSSEAYSELYANLIFPCMICCGENLKKNLAKNVENYSYVVRRSQSIRIETENEKHLRLGDEKPDVHETGSSVNGKNIPKENDPSEVRNVNYVKFETENETNVHMGEKRPDVHGTGSEVNGEKMRASRNIKNKEVMLSAISEENVVGENIAEQRNKPNNANNEMERTRFSHTKKSVRFYIKNFSTVGSNLSYQETKEKKRESSPQTATAFGVKLDLSRQDSIYFEEDEARRKAVNRMTAMLISLTAIYMIGYLPFLLLTLYKNVFPQNYADLNPIQMTFYNLFLRFYYLNSAANPVVYSLCDGNFRRECMRLLRCRRIVPK